MVGEPAPPMITTSLHDGTWTASAVVAPEISERKRMSSVTEMELELEGVAAIGVHIMSRYQEGTVLDLNRTETKHPTGEAGEHKTSLQSFQTGFRRDDRMAIKFSIWAPSPTEDELRNRSPSPDREVKKKASKNKRAGSDDSDSDDSAGGRQHRHKSHKRSKDKRQSRSRHKGSNSKRSSGRSSKRRRRSVSLSSHSDEDDRDSKLKSRKHKNSSSRSPSRGHRHRSSSASSVQKEGRALARTPPPVQLDEMDYPDDMWVEKKIEMPDDDQEVGPVPLHLQDSKMNERSYGGALLAGEGSAMAAYVQDGKRIPRRGEIGLESDQIEHYENAGFVMSGSRHQRMNAVRVRKENQVISAEEKRALMIFNQEEKIKKDNKIINEMREMVASKLRSTGHSV
ncbi:hypothetical protein BGZ72_011044 [Mortierella alpina]|nr:hypothetical protein BGZ72_011044 [Mortierella alpina]